MNRSRRGLLLGFAASAALSLAAGGATAQTVVYDPAAVAQAIRQVSQGLQQIEALQNQLQQQAQMLARLGLDVTAPLRNIASEATGLLKQAQGLGYQAANIAQDFAKLYPANLAGLSPQDLAARLTTWAQSSRSTLQEAMQVQNQIAQAQVSTSGAVASAVDASQSAAGQTAAVQATNQLLAALSTQLTQLQALLITQGRQAQTFEAERQGLMAKGHADALRNSVVRQAPPRFSGNSL